MTVSKEQIDQMVRNQQGIPQNPEVAAKMVQPLPSEQPTATPPGLDPATPAEQGLDPAADVDFFGTLAADMDAETQSSPAPSPHPQQQPGVAPVEELPYEVPVHQRQAGETPESLLPQIGPEEIPLEAAIEQPLVEEELRMTAEEWASQQRTLNTPQEELPPQIEQPQIDPVELETRAINHLMETEYVLSESDKTALIAEPDTVLPRLAARMHVRMQVQMAQHLSQIIPGIVQNMIKEQGKATSLENAFFGQYPELNKPQYRGTVQESIMMIRNVNPNASRDEVMRDGAALAAVRLRTKLGNPQPSAPPQALPGNMPLGPTAAPQTVPFTPAQSGGGQSEPVVPIDPNQDNIFGILAMDNDW